MKIKPMMTVALLSLLTAHCKRSLGVICSLSSAARCLPLLAEFLFHALPSVSFATGFLFLATLMVVLWFGFGCIFLVCGGIIVDPKAGQVSGGAEDSGQRNSIGAR
jgi:bacteriorhodopsin